MKITAIGEILFDVYPDSKKLGGAPFNFIHHVWKLTGEGNFISRVGADDDGKEILMNLKKKEFDTAHIQIDDEHKTGIVDVKLDEKKVPDFDIKENRAYDFINYNNELRFLVRNSDLYYFGSLAQRNEVTRKTINELTDESAKNFCDLNIRQNYYSEEIIRSSLEKSDVVKLNTDELKLVNKYLLKKDFELEPIAKLAADKFDIELLCITLGADGALLFRNGEISHHKETIDDIVDTVGAGDAYAALLAIGYLSDWELGKINEFASKFSAEICRVNGAIPADNELYNKFREKIDNG